MKLYPLAVVAILTPTLGAQQVRSQTDGLVYVRAIRVEGDRSGPHISWNSIQSALKENGVGLAVELKTTPEALADLASRADQVIQRTYENAGRTVLVEHEIIVAPAGRYVEVRFRVTPGLAAAKPK